MEQKRSIDQGKQRISDRAFLQVFSMLIEYGILGYEYLNRRRLSREEREEYFRDIRSIALLMKVEDFPTDYHQYQTARTQMVVREFQFNSHTSNLMAAFHRGLGPVAYWALLQFQARFIDPILARRLGLTASPWFGGLYRAYPYLRFKPIVSTFWNLLTKENRPAVLKHQVEGSKA